MESGKDIFYPFDGNVELYMEQLQYPFEDLIEVRRVKWQLEEWPFSTGTTI
jgi:hypothetical protein